MGLQLKGENENAEKNNITQDVDRKEQNPWDAPKAKDDLFEEPVVVYNTVTAQAAGERNEDNPIGGMIVKIIVAFVVCGVLIFGGKKIVSVLMPEGTDITPILKENSDVIASQLGVTFTDNPSWVSNIYHFAEGTTTVKAAEDIGIVYLNGKQAGVHITDKTYTIFDVQIGDGEAEMYNHTTYPYDNFISVVDTVNGGKSSLYIYYSQSRNDCIVFMINNTTNRIQSMTYYSNYKLMTTNMDTF